MNECVFVWLTLVHVDLHKILSYRLSLIYEESSVINEFHNIVVICYFVVFGKIL